jgi:hypothetical protein
VTGALALVLLTLPSMVAAQVSPTAPPHPSMPWSGITTPQGQMIRFIYVPPQPVTLEYLVMGPTDTPPPAAEPAPPTEEPKTEEKTPEPAAPSEGPPPSPRIVRQQVTVPGYYVRETTVGFHYPERWAIEQVAPNVYRWRQVPAQFIPK